MPSVVVNENFKMFHGHQPLSLEAGQVVTGSLAELLSRTARKRVTVIEDEQPDTGSDGGEQQEQEPPTGDQDPADDLDIDASVADVLTWVGDDPERAVAALDLEEAKDNPRSTLVKQLTKIADA
ncbi:hypothetical protein ACFSUJ_12275 [Streptomyces lusitanus]|uniref:Uncharacterized protein n=1 Tax=Streptomyces lusitanus TaxID=68232 RepID=A0ABU3JP79_9ACTN|nr:hypothetical protein [Streptomyces lusitanus]